MSEPRAYYNEHDKFAAAWLRNLEAEGLIPPGDVDERDICDVRPADLVGYTQGHFFAGIGGWPLGLRLAGWPDRRPVWTGSCPCQPFSIANAAHRKRAGRDDARHLLPQWLRLIEESDVPIVFGEQVKEAIAFGWLDELFDGMERLGYACGSSTAPACSVGSPQERERLWFVCDADGERYQGLREPEAHPRARDAVAPWRSAVRTGRPYRGKTWLTQPGLCRLADGLSAGVACLRPYGNAFVPQVAAEFIGAYLDAEHFRLALTSGVFA